MAEYVNVTRDMLEAHLLPQGFQLISLPGCVELVYSKRADWNNGVKIAGRPEISIRVFTGINPDGNSRGVGEDAMRVQVAFAEPMTTAEFLEYNSQSYERNQPFLSKATGPNPPKWVKWITHVGGSKRVHRVKGWKVNLQNRIDNWEELLGPLCPICGAPTVLREPKRGQTWNPFYSCARYRTRGCKGSVRVPAKEVTA